MKISNETKVGALTVIAVTLLVLGFNFLKGQKIGSTNVKLYAVFTDIQGLAVSNSVVINGKQVGSISATDFNEDLTRITVGISLKKDYPIPDSSLAVISKDLLGTTVLEIKLIKKGQPLNNGDTMRTAVSDGLLSETMKKLDPVLYEVKNTVKSLDSVLMAVNSIIDPVAKNNIQNMLANLSRTSTTLAASSASLEILLNTQTGALAKTLDNVNSFTGNLAKNNEKVNGVLTNLDKTTSKISNLDFEKTLATLDGTISDLKTSISKLTSNNGTLGLLINDTRLYNNLASTANKINLLIDDLRTNPKRYVNVSVFGKKNTSPPLAFPLPDTTNAPYIRIEKVKQ